MYVWQKHLLILNLLLLHFILRAIENRSLTLRTWLCDYLSWVRLTNELLLLLLCYNFIHWILNICRSPKSQIPKIVLAINSNDLQIPRCFGSLGLWSYTFNRQKMIHLTLPKLPCSLYALQGELHAMASLKMKMKDRRRVTTKKDVRVRWRKYKGFFQWCLSRYLLVWLIYI